MSNIKTHNNFYQFFKIFSLGMLLLLSPCSVRNSIQSALQLEQTEVTNKSKVAQLNSNCVTFDTSKIGVSSHSKKQSKANNLVSLNSNYIGLKFVSFSEKQIPFQTVNQCVVPLKVPLYILYKNKKDFILA
ncbi:hypothetical protein [uncultured Formosa sp.]|uniref:hypothetical protein n=1 Tax=uncultured Formosa sp. TaxID=255435 RepID=UPI00261E5A97|nr:hypothetical protein [uncultured Formosa sp.]